MKSKKTMVTVDSHTCGEPTRVIIGGLPNLRGKSIMEKRMFMEKEIDYIRTALVKEPRGHHSMVIAVLTPPSVPEADVGLFFASPGGYHNMCGHGTIGVATTLIEMGMVQVQEPITKLTLETPAGLIVIHADVKDGVARSVTFRNQPAFLYQRDLIIEVPDLGRITVDVAYGGNWFAILPASKVGLKISPQNINEILLKGTKIKETVGQTVPVRHPGTDIPGVVDSVMFTGPPCDPKADGKNVVVTFVQGFDRSPCGTGTCARLALLYSKGELELNKMFVHESILGGLFRGQIVQETRVGNLTAVVPEITGTAHITGIHHFLLDSDDPLRDGFLVG